MTDRRNFIKQTGLLSMAGIIGANQIASAEKPSKLYAPTRSKWADGSRLVVSATMLFEAGGQPDNAPSPFPPNMKPGFKDLPAATWYEYGYKEGIPRMLDNWDKLGIKVTTHMVGSAVLKNPALAKEIVDRGHEASGHGMTWKDEYDMSYDEEKKFIKDGLDAIKKVTGQTAIGYNANFLRRSENTLKILQELGCIYHIDDLGRDEPFIIKVNQKDFAVVPYTVRNNDLGMIELRNFSPDQYITQIKMEFDQLYEEAATRRRQLSLTFHDRVSGTPQMVKAATELIKYMQKHPGVAFKRKDEIAEMTLKDPTSLHEQSYI
ncbi:polysaccharide deacetylase family protein [Mucilaginibacter sp. KACC 22063]|uniref:polysaccharide deacetylase family protein n=1 Tax=Mucilaginibacter sp. KACC 22063 TaxID=3025666 RepID=UPI002365507B|nr:polysaccharide deacetylase family protein [Mucilaginibacter sp. KACC 22063]WDF57270.1 polysaccharide deacetylase family protein [Mucilaginibacter sp. KACC 22063]